MHTIQNGYTMITPMAFHNYEVVGVESMAP